MSIINATIIALWLNGFLAALLVALFLYFYLAQREDRHKTQNEARRDRNYETALSLEVPETIEVRDDQMICTPCWEERHPGSQWCFGKETLCLFHQALEQQYSTKTI